MSEHIARSGSADLQRAAYSWFTKEAPFFEQFSGIFLKSGLSPREEREFLTELIRKGAVTTTPDFVHVLRGLAFLAEFPACALHLGAVRLRLQPEVGDVLRTLADAIWTGDNQALIDFATTAARARKRWEDEDEDLFDEFGLPREPASNFKRPSEFARFLESRIGRLGPGVSSQSDAGTMALLLSYGRGLVEGIDHDLEELERRIRKELKPFFIGAPRTPSEVREVIEQALLAVGVRKRAIRNFLDAREGMRNSRRTKPAEVPVKTRRRRLTKKNR